MKSLLTILTLTALTYILVAGCGNDNALRSVTPETPGLYTVQLTVQPPTSLRTDDTWNNWTTPAQVVFRTNFEDAVEADNHTTKPITGEHSDIMIGQTVVEGYRMTVRSGTSRTFWRRGHDGMEAHVPDSEETHHIKVYLEDTLEGHTPHDGGNIPGADIHMEYIVDGEEKVIELHPVQGRHGYRYEANADVPLNAYDMRVHALPPTMSWDEHTRDRWTGGIEATFHGYDFSTGTADAAVEVQGLKVSLQADAPRAYGAIGIGQLPMHGDETVSFSVQMEDTTIDMSNDGEMIADCVVTMVVTNEETGHTTVQTLTPMYGEDGFHYAANFSLPEDETILGSPDDGHHDDGHLDDGHHDDGHLDDGHQDENHHDDGHLDDNHQDDNHQNNGPVH